MPNYNPFPSRATIRGGVYGGMLDQAFVTTRTHSQWTTPAWGGTRDLEISVDGGASIQTLTLSPSTTYTIEQVVSDINTLFIGVGLVALAWRAGRLLLRSLTSGIDSEVDISGSDQDALDLFRFNRLNARGRTLEETPESEGVEDNPAGTLLVGATEQLVREVINRPSTHFGTVSDAVARFLAGDYATPRQREVLPIETRTVHDLRGCVLLTLSTISTSPQINETIVGVTSGVSGVVANRTGNTLVVAPPLLGFSGSFSVGETLDGATSGAGFAVVGIVTEDDRIIAVKLKGNAWVGSSEAWGTSSPSSSQLASAFSLSVYGASRDGAPQNTVAGLPTSSADDLSAGRLPLVRGEVVEVAHVCIGEPDDFLQPTNVYDHVGVLRQSSVGITSWTKNRIYPATFSANVQAGDICVISGSTSSGLTLNDGNYRIVAIDAIEEFYQIGPSQPGVGLLPDTTVEDAELYADNGVVGVSLEVYSPSYLLEESRVDTGSNDTTGWLLLSRPIAPDLTLTLTDYEVTTPYSKPSGEPHWESAWSRSVRSRVDSMHERMSRADWGALATGALREDSGAHRTGTYSDLVLVQGLSSQTSHADTSRLFSLAGPARQHLLSREGDPTVQREVPSPLLSLSGLGYRQDAEVPVGYVGPVQNAYDRPARLSIALFSYTSKTATPLEREVLTGASSGAEGIYLGEQPNVAANRMLVEFIDGTDPHVDGETFDFAGPNTVVGMTFVRWVGFTYVLPYSTSGSTLTGAKGLTTITYSGSPAHMDNVRAGDLLWDFGSSVTNRPRIESVDTGTGTIELQEPLPYDVLSTEWGVLAGLGAVDILGTSTGGYCDQASRYIHLYVASPAIPDPTLQGVQVGDAICVTTDPGGVSTDGTGQEYLPIRQIINKATGDIRYVIEVGEEDAYKITNASDVAWRIQTRHQRVALRVRGHAEYSSYDGTSYDGDDGDALFQWSGPAYWMFPATRYATPHLGGAIGRTITGVTGSGLNGRTLTLRLTKAGQPVVQTTITYATNPVSLTSIAGDTQALLSAALVDWVKCHLAVGRIGLVFSTVGKSSYNDASLPAYCGLGPDVALDLTGEALDALSMGSTEIERGNLSEIYEASGYAELYRLVALRNPSSSIFLSDGLSTLVRRQAALGTSREQEPLHSLRAFVDNHSLLRYSSGGHDGSFVGEDRPTLTLHANVREKEGGEEKRTALSVSTVGKTVAMLTHGGSLSIRERKGMVEEGEGYEAGAVFYGEYGLRPAPLYTGPMTLPVDGAGDSGFEGHALVLMIGRDDPTTRKQTTRRVLIEFTSGDTTLSAAATTAQTLLTGASISWVKCVVDESGLGLKFYVDENETPPAYHARTFLAFDPMGTTFPDLYARSQKWGRMVEGSFYYGENVDSAQKLIGAGLSSTTSGALTQGHAGGLLVERGSGRRLVSPAQGHRQDGPYVQAQQQSVVFDEVLGYIKPLLDPSGADGSFATTGDFPDHEETVLWSLGSRKNNRVFLFATDGALSPFDRNERIEVTTHPGTGVDTYVLTDVYEAQWSSESVQPGDHLPNFQCVGHVAELFRSLTAPEGVHAGGALVEGLTSGVFALINPVAIRVTDEVSTPTWTLGDLISGDLTYGGAFGYYGGTVSVVAGSITHKWYLLYGCTSRFVDWSTEQQSDNMYRVIGATAVEPLYTGRVEQVVQLNSYCFGYGHQKPVAALSTRSYNTNDGHLEKPAIHSFGDVTVPYGGDYLWRDRVPNWASGKETPIRIAMDTVSGPLTVGETIFTGPDATDARLDKYGILIADLGSDVWAVRQVQGPPFCPGDAIEGATSGETANVIGVTAYDRHFAAAKHQPHGRAFATEMLAEDGRVIEYYRGGSLYYPEISNGTNLLSKVEIIEDILTAPTLLTELSGYDTNQGQHSVAWLARATSFPAEIDQHYGIVTFHPTVPDGFVWVEGFGAYIRHDYVSNRKPAVISLHAVGGQGKEGVFPYWYADGSLTDGGNLINNGYMHRLEVYDTKEQIIRVDSAGLGSFDNDHVSTWIPPWANADETYSWMPFRPFPLLPHTERFLELFIASDEAVHVPIIGSPIYVATTLTKRAPMPVVRGGTVVYVERYGESTISAGPTYTPTTRGFRLFVHLGPSSGPDQGGFARGYPLNTDWDASPNALPRISPPEHTPHNIHLYPWSLFMLGEKVQWDGVSSGSQGIVQYIQRYPHGMNLRIKAHLLASSLDLSTQEDLLAGVYLRYRTDRINLSRI